MKRLLVTILLFLPLVINSQSSPSVDQIHSAYIYQMTRYIYWPEDHREGDFYIDVIGEGDIANELKKLASKREIDGRKIVVNRIKSVKEVDPSHHIIFITKSKSNTIEEIVKKSKGSGLLIITESRNALNKGSMINFKLSNSKVFFELGMSELDKKKFKISQQLRDLESK